MDKQKIKWSAIVVVDVLLINIAFLLAYLTSRQFGFNPLEQPTSLSAILQRADISSFQHFLGDRRPRHDSSRRFFIGVQHIQTDVATRLCSGISETRDRNPIGDFRTYHPRCPIKNRLGPILD